MITKKVGLALGGGGAKGLAHMGVIKALVNAGITIDYIAGTSMGALVGGWYAATGDVDNLEDLVLHVKKSDFFSVKEIMRGKDSSFFRAESIADKLRKELGDIQIEELKIPFTALATNTKDGSEIRIKNGNLVDAIRASIALPIVFAPVKIDDHLLIDGGLVNPVPADVVKNMGAEYIIAVDVSSKWFTAPDELITGHDTFQVISGALGVIEYQIARDILKNANLVLRPPVMSYNWLEFDKAHEIIKKGEEELELNLREIRRNTGYKKLPQTIAEKFLDFILNKPD